MCNNAFVAAVQCKTTAHLTVIMIFCCCRCRQERGECVLYFLCIRMQHTREQWTELRFIFFVVPLYINAFQLVFLSTYVRSRASSPPSLTFACSHQFSYCWHLCSFKNPNKWRETLCVSHNVKQIKCTNKQKKTNVENEWKLAALHRIAIFSTRKKKRQQQK